MTAPYYEDDLVTLHHGDALNVARTLADESVACIVTSPPYFGLRDYGSDGQYGLEATPAEYVETMRALFSELRRVLADDGTLWLNIGDSYGKGKQLLGIPWRVALALQGDGWTLRNAIVWHKPNAMPDPTADRLSTTYEMVFLLSKSPRYAFSVDEIREAAITAGRKQTAPTAQRAGSYSSASGSNNNEPTSSGLGCNAKGKNPGDVWAISPQPFGGAHFAVMPREIARRAIIAGCKQGGTVLDPFSGSGTTGQVSIENGRRYIGIDLSAEYLDLSLRERFAQPPLNMEAAA